MHLVFSLRNPFCNGYFVVICLFLLPSNPIFAQTYQETADSLINLYKGLKNAEEQVDLLNEISYAYRRVSGDSVMKYGVLAHQKAIEIGYTKGESIAHKHIGIGHYKLSAPRDSIIYHYQKAIDLAKEIDDFYTQAACNNNIALTLYDNGKFNFAIRYFLQGIEIFDTHFEEDSRLKLLMIANTGVSFKRLGEFEKSLQYVERAINLAKKNKETSILTMYLDDYGQILILNDRLEEAEAVLNQSLILQKKSGDFMSEAWVLNHKAELEMRFKRFESAKKLSLEARKISETREFFNSKIYSELNLARIALVNKKTEEAIQYITSIIEESKGLDRINYIQDAREIGVKAYKQKKDFSSALSLLEAHKLLEDSILINEKRELTAELEAKYDNKEKLNQINFLNKEKELNASRIQLLMVLIIGAFLSSLYILFLLKKRNQSSKIIEEKNEELQKYIDYNLQLENFAYIASHDLKTPLRTIVSFSQLLKRTAQSKLTVNEIDYLSFIINGTKEMSSLIDDLLDYSSVQRTSLNKEVFELDAFIQNILNKNSVFLHEKKAQITLDLQALSIKADKLKFQQLLQNLILNGVKFHKPEEISEILIKSELADNQVIISIKDNGIGIEKSYFDKIFLIFKRLNKKEEYQGTGIGLAIAKKIVDLHDGKIWVDSELGKGTTFFVSIPNS